MSFVLVQWLLGVTYLVHPFFISMTDINQNTNDQTLEVSVRIFTDDFENNLRKTCQCKVALINPADKAVTENMVSGYISRHLQIKVNGKPATMQFAGYQQEEGSTWSYFEIKHVQAVQTVEITNSVMYEFSEQQVNMLHLKINGIERTDKLEFPKKTWSAMF